MTTPSRIGGSCAAPNCLSTVLFSASKFCTAHQSLACASSANSGQHPASQSGKSRLPSRGFIDKSDWSHSSGGSISRTPTRSQEMPYELFSTGSDNRNKPPTIAHIEKRRTSTQSLTRRGSHDEQEKNHPFRGTKLQSAVSVEVKGRSRSIDRPTNAVVHAKTTEGSAKAAKTTLTAQINLPISSGLLERPSMRASYETEKSVSRPCEGIITKKAPAPVANIEPGSYFTGRPKTNMKRDEQTSLSLSPERSNSTRQELPEHLLSVLKPAFARELKRAGTFVSHRKISPAVPTRPRKPHPENASQSKYRASEPKRSESASYSPKPPLPHAKIPATEAVKTSPQRTSIQKILSDRECSLPGKTSSEKENPYLEKALPGNALPVKQRPSHSAAETAKRLPQKIPPEENCRLSKSTSPEQECTPPADAQVEGASISKAPLEKEPSRSDGAPRVKILLETPLEKTSQEQALPEKERLPSDLLPEGSAEIDNEVNMIDISDTLEGEAAQPTQASLLSFKAKVDARQKQLLATFDPIAFDSIIYRQSRLRPPPGVSLSSHIVKNGPLLDGGERLYLPVNPAIHKMHKRSQRWYKQKCEEIKRRPTRKAWFGKVMARKRWLLAEERKLEEKRQEALCIGAAPPYRPPEPRSVKQILDFGDVPEEDLPDYVRSNPAWLKACAWHRECEEKATQHQRQVDKSIQEAERYFKENFGGANS